MKLKDLLAEKKTVIVKSWFDLVVATYPPDSVGFFKNQKDPFANPVGVTTQKGLEALFEGILENAERDTFIPFLDPIIRIRAVQDFIPSKAMAFIIDLKQIIRSELKKELREPSIFRDLSQIDHRIDRLSLISFDLYMGCREQIYQLKVDTEKKKIYKAFSRAGLITEASQ
jgi:hypothetical protein